MLRSRAALALGTRHLRQGCAEARLGWQPMGGPSSAEPVARQGCGVLETIPDAALLGQELMALGADMGSSAVGG